MPNPEQTMKKMRLDPARFPSTPEERAAALIAQWPLQPQEPVYDDEEMTPEQARQTTAILRQQLEQDLAEARARYRPKPSADAAPPKERESNGRFAKGNRGGTGNPFARQTAALRAALIQSVTEQDIKDIVTVLVRDAKRGHLAAIKLLFAYVIGKPAAAVDPDTLDAQEMDLLQQSVPSPDTLETLRLQLPLSVLLEQLHNAQANNAVHAAQTTQHKQPAQVAQVGPTANATEAAPQPQETSSPPVECTEPATTPAAPSTNDENGSQPANHVDKQPAFTAVDNHQPVGKRKKRPSPNDGNGARDPEVPCDDGFPVAKPSSGHDSET
jgi:hypothetical protein